MHIILKDGTRLNHIGATGGIKNIQNERCDAITFEFDGSYDVDTLRAAFTEANCETIIIVTDETVEKTVENEDGTTELKNEIVYTNNYHEGYVIRYEVTEKIKEVAPDVTETHVFVTMAQRTYTGKKLAELEAQNLDTAMAVAELGVLLAGGIE